jgi:hypothetical protein
MVEGEGENHAPLMLLMLLLLLVMREVLIVACFQCAE